MQRVESDVRICELVATEAETLCRHRCPFAALAPARLIGFCTYATPPAEISHNPSHLVCRPLLPCIGLARGLALARRTVEAVMPDSGIFIREHVHFSRQGRPAIVTHGLQPTVSCRANRRRYCAPSSALCNMLVLHNVVTWSLRIPLFQPL